MRARFTHTSLAKSAAHRSWANTADRSERTAPARRKFLERFEQQVDPDAVLSEAERARRAESALKAHFADLAYRSAMARRAAKSKDGDQ